MTDELRVLLINDHVLCRRGLTDLLEHRDAGILSAGLEPTTAWHVGLIKETLPPPRLRIMLSIVTACE